jgi:hypothetical protein
MYVPYLVLCMYHGYHGSVERYLYVDFEVWLYRTVTRVNGRIVIVLFDLSWRFLSFLFFYLLLLYHKACMHIQMFGLVCMSKADEVVMTTRKERAATEWDVRE